MSVVIVAKVRIVITPDQAQVWADEYGIERKDVPADIKQWIETAVQEAPAFEGGGYESVTVT